MKLCMGCMNEMEDHLTQCPLCGYDETTQKQESYYLSPGSVLGGKYIVGKALRYNGYTVSYLGLDAETGRKVTVREYLPSEFSTRSEGEAEITIYSGDALEQFNRGVMSFLNEGSRMQKLGNIQGIATIYDCVAENETGYLISEFQDGVFLQDLLEQGKLYSWKDAAAMILPILGGLSKVHSQGILHCDIAPDTILVGANGGAKLTDFCSTKFVTSSNSRSLAVILKKGYAAEEQYRSQGVRGTWTDVYAMAAVFYRMVTGKKLPESVDRILEDTLMPPSKAGVKLSASQENALLNALNVYAKERTQTVGQFRQDLTGTNVKRIRPSKKGTDTGKMPVSVKVAIAALGCFVLAGGGFVIHRQLTHTQTTVSSNTEKFSMKAYSDEEQFRKFWEENGFEPEYEKLDISYQYGDVQGNEITGWDWLYDGLTVHKMKALIEEKGAPKLSITSDRKFDFNDRWVYGCQMGKDAVFLEENGSDALPYGYIESITYEGKTYTISYDKNGNCKKESLKTLPQTMEFNGKDSPTFTIYTGDYYVSNKVTEENCIGKKPEKLAVFTLVKSNGSSRKNMKNKTLSKDKISEELYSFARGDSKGVIKELHPKITSGKYDSREVHGPVFYTVKKCLEYRKTTVKDLEALGVTIKDRKKYSDRQLVVSCKCDGKEYFRTGDTVEITVEDPATPKPAQPTAAQQQPQQQEPAQEPAQEPKQKQESGNQGVLGGFDAQK